MALAEISVVFLALISSSYAYYCLLYPDQICQSGTACTAGTLIPGTIWCPSNMVCCKLPPDVDECATIANVCDTHAFCTNTRGSYYCTCNSGYQGNGGTCTDINECSDSTICGSNAVCTNTPGSYQCTCNAGFQKYGKTCRDIDECAQGIHNCGVGSYCQNQIGSYSCPCRPGYQPNGAACVDIDECSTGLAACDVNAVCTNTESSYYCTCRSGFTWNGFYCTDIDECTQGTHSCGVGSYCQNQIGSYKCVCTTGYQWNGVACVDIDECATGSNQCSPFASCSNTGGSYTCTCRLGFSGSGFQCTDIDECAANTYTCAGTSVCSNTPGSYQCTCATGFQYNGLKCVDIDECVTGTHNCGLTGTCSNNVGSYTCTCGPGYYANGTQCTEYPCGTIGPLRRVNNGQNAARCAWPWQLSVRRNLVAPNPPSLLTSVHECAGTLLSPYWFLTTPECILYTAKYNVAANPQTEAFVVAGDSNVNIDESIEQLLTISQIFIHPDYPNVNTYEELTDYFGHFSNISKQANAFALVKLTTPVAYTDCVKHICLPEQDGTFCEQPCAVTGWGYDSSFSYVNQLQEAYMTLFTVDSCKAIDVSFNNADAVHPDKTICAGSVNNVWPCLGDDGGPISCKEGSHYVLRGIYSYPDNCGDTTNGISLLAVGDVSKVVTWIKTTMMSN